jgi:hypothetical protein
MSESYGFLTDTLDTERPAKAQNEFIRDLFPEIAPKFSSIRDRTIDTYKDVLPKARESLDNVSSADEALSYLQRIDRELFQGKWGDTRTGRRVDFFYSDSPTECDEYCYIRDEIVTPALDKLVEVSGDLSAEGRLELLSKMESFIQQNYDYNAWSFDRVSALVPRMLDIGGVDALPSLLRVAEDLVGRDYMEDASGLSPAMLEFDVPDHTGFHTSLVESIGSYPWKNEDERSAAARHLTEHMSMGSQGNLRTYIAAYQNLGLESSIPYLLTNLNEENLLVRRMSAEILFRLELGERPVEEGELEILGKVFKLATEKGQQQVIESLQTARRLDSHGRWAVFDESGGAKGTFTIEAEDLAPQAQGKKIEKSIDLELGNLFREACIRRVDETPEDRLQREHVFGVYLEHFSEVIDGMYERTGVWLNSLELHEQAFFVHTYRQAVAEGRDTALENIVKKYGEEALKVFVTMEYGESGDAILEFLGSSDVNEHTKKSVLSGFYELSHRAGAWRNVFTSAEMVTGHRFSSEIYEAFIRKSSEYYRAAMMIERGEGGDVSMQELLNSLSTVVYSLKVMEGLYKENGDLRLEGKPQIQAECADAGCIELIEDARTTWILSDQKTGDRIVLSVRPQATVMVGNRPGGEARINFKISNNKKGLEARIGIDLSDYGEYIGQPGKPAVVSLDLGTGIPDREEGIYPSQRVGRVLSLVEGSEGGHNEASFSAKSAQYFKDISHSLTDYMESRFTQ